MSHEPKPFRPGRAIDEGRKAGKRFGIQLAEIIKHLDTNYTSVATAAGLDSSTIDRICNGHTKPTYQTFYAIVQAVHSLDRSMGILLAREMYDLCRPEGELDGDYNGDGKEDADDMLHALAKMLDCVNDLMMLTLSAFSDGQIDNDEFLKITSVNQKIRDHSNRHQRIAQLENDRHSRKRVRRNT